MRQQRKNWKRCRVLVQFSGADCFLSGGSRRISDIGRVTASQWNRKWNLFPNCPIPIYNRRTANDFTRTGYTAIRIIRADDARGEKRHRIQNPFPIWTSTSPRQRIFKSCRTSRRNRRKPLFVCGHRFNIFKIFMNCSMQTA